jgi:hypothetical protein
MTRLLPSFLIGLACVLGLSAPLTASAQAADEGTLRAVIIGSEDSPVGRRIILDASASRIVGNNVQYLWYVNDQPEPISKTVDAIYTPEGPGEVSFRLVVRATVNGQTRDSEPATHTVNVYRRKVVLVADGHVPEEEIQRLQERASAAGTFLRVLRSGVAASDRNGEEALNALASEQSDALFDADTVVLWTDGLPATGLQALMKAVKNPGSAVTTMERQTLVLLTDLSLKSYARTAQGPLEVLRPARTLVTRPDELTALLSTADADAFLRAVRQEDHPDQVILDASVVRVSPWLPLANLVRYMLEQGVSSQTVILFLVLPVIATMLAFLRQVVGMSTFGLFTPAIVALSFLVLGWLVGVLSLVFILATGYASRSLMRRLHILFIPKMAIILGIGSITLLLLISIATAFGVVLSHDTVFVLLIMTTLVESFLTVKSEQGLLSAMFAIGQTILAALICYVVVQWQPFRLLIVAYPEIIILTILINVLLGRFTGLRVSEYFRFREVFRHMAAEE